MKSNISIVGGGINGLLAAFLVSMKYPHAHIDIYDADKHPNATIHHSGTTHGSRDARHITGSESIGFENSIHKDALRNTPQHSIPGWLLKKEGELTYKEKEWRKKFEDSYIGSTLLNKLDFAHAELNYRGLSLWRELANEYPFIEKHILTDGGVEVYFMNQTAFKDDFAMETEFCHRYSASQVKVVENDDFANLYPKKLVVPGMSIRVKSLAIDLLNRLERNIRVGFHWGVVVKDVAQLKSEIIVWASGVTHKQPAEYSKYNVQGIVGCWVTIPNKGYKAPFKIATPAPSAYINFTPDGRELHISGGFGWTGEYAEASRTKLLAKPVAKHFIEQINKYLDTKIATEDVDYCIRASTPTGQPLLLTKNYNGKKYIFISGSAKSGTTHAPVLSDYVLEQINRQSA